MKQGMKKALAIGGAVALAGVSFLGGFTAHQPDTVVKEVPVVKLVEVPVEVEVPVVEVQEVVQEVFIEDVEFLEKVCDRMMFDDIMECKEEVNAEDEALKLALELVEDKDKLFDFLEDEGFIVDEDEARLVKLYDDFEDIEIIESNFDDEEYEFKIKVRVEDEEEDEKFRAWLTLKVEEGEAEFSSVELDE